MNGMIKHVVKMWLEFEKVFQDHNPFLGILLETSVRSLKTESVPFLNNPKLTVKSIVSFILDYFMF